MFPPCSCTCRVYCPDRVKPTELVWQKHKLVEAGTKNNLTDESTLFKTLFTETLLTMTLPNLSRAVRLIRVEDVLKTFLGAFSKDVVSGEAESGCTSMDHVKILTPSTIIEAVNLPLMLMAKLPEFDASAMF